MTEDRPDRDCEVVLTRHRDGTLSVDRATSTMWFARHALDHIENHAEYGWSFDGSHIGLGVDNGRWVWKLTGRTWQQDYGPGSQALIMCEAVWPD